MDSKIKYRIDKTKLALLEATLFTTHQPLTLEQIAKILKVRNPDAVRVLIDAVREKYNTQEHGISLSETGGYRLVVKKEFVERVSHLTPHADLSRGVLRVLSIVAFHEPVEQSEIVKVVGNRTYEYVKELQERGLIKGERKGRTKILSTTPHFEEYFGVKKAELRKELKNTNKKKELKNIEKKEEKEPES